MTMASTVPALKWVLVFSLFLVIIEAKAGQRDFKLSSAAEDGWSPVMSIYYDELSGDGGEEDGEYGRRSLYEAAKHYYISYGALSANRVPCPPRSGRSYYTQNCYGANNPVNPYHRGCSCITQCRS
ncbi:hypothetical protein Tsubulata_040044 [Turnera subulata]|uniref:Rapid ALkalinization Factor n=1 Tax=Turnera subulata TaxID=218843 RepID=A0A9Q0JQ49_9ROSI|nr:hypothetical protein Tsubulata_040044 [Turnera subulata]